MVNSDGKGERSTPVYDIFDSGFAVYCMTGIFLFAWKNQVETTEEKKHPIRVFFGGDFYKGLKKGEKDVKFDNFFIKSY